MLIVWVTEKVTNSNYKVLLDSLGTPYQVVMQSDIPDIESIGCILALGSNPLAILIEHRVIPKNRTISSLRGSVFQNRLMVSYPPSIEQVDYDKWIQLNLDTVIAARYAFTGSLTPKLGDYTSIASLGEFLSEVAQRYKDTPIKVALDLETMGAEPYDSTKKILSIHLSHTPGTACGLYLGTDFNPDFEFLRDLTILLQSPKIKLRGANMKFDLTWLYIKFGIKCTNFTFDTFLVGSLLNENRSNSLKTHAFFYTQLGGYSQEFDQRYDKGHMELVPVTEMMTYGGGDADCTIQVSQGMERDLIKDTQLLRFYTTILHPASRAFEALEQEGILVDKVAYQKLGNQLENEIAQVEAKALAMIPGRIRVKWRGKESLTKAKMLCEYMFSPVGLGLKPKKFTAKTNEPSTALEHLLMFEDDPKAKQFVGYLKEYNSAAKTLSTYVNGFLNHLRQDGKLHPSYYLANSNEVGEGGTNTGRLSARNPAFQCLEGSSLVITSQGAKTILSMVEGFEKGEEYKVLTHTGKYRDVIGVYRNGIRPVFKVILNSGKYVVCTENHPLLTFNGFIETRNLKVGSKVYIEKDCNYAKICRSRRREIWEISSSLYCSSYKKESILGVFMRLWGYSKGSIREFTERQYFFLWLFLGGGKDYPRASECFTWREDDSYLQELGRYEKQVFKPKKYSLPPIRRAGYKIMRELVKVREFFGRYGGKAERLLYRESRCKWGLLPRELQMDSEKKSNKEYQENPLDYLQGYYHVSVRLGEIYETWRCFKEQTFKRMDFRERDRDSYQAKKAGYVLDTIVSITPVGKTETYDLTIDKCHSFIANGVVVHNTIPKSTKYAKPLRKCFIAPEGWVILGSDFSQGELRIAACLANEANMIKAYQENKDLHALTGAALGGYSWDEFVKLKETNKGLYDKHRNDAKPANFGLLYGLGAKGYMEYAKTSYGISMSIEEATKARDTFFETYPRLIPWHNEYKAFAKKHGYVRSPLGRIRHLPLINSKDSFISSKAERNAVNSPVQSCLSDMALWSMAILHREYDFYGDSIRGWGAVHDQNLFLIREDKVDELVPLVKQIMENLPFHELGWEPQVKFTVDSQVGGSLGTLKDWYPGIEIE